MPSSPIENKESRQYSIRLPWRVSNAVRDYALQHDIAANRAIIELIERGLRTEYNAECNTQSTTAAITAQIDPDLLARIEALEARLQPPLPYGGMVSRFNPETQYMDRLCGRRHSWEGSGQSRYSKRNRRCVECENEAKREARTRNKATATQN